VSAAVQEIDTANFWEVIYALGVPQQSARCVSCHMPPIMNSLVFQARSHQVDDIPRVDLTPGLTGRTARMQA
jgi:hypothetical protein